MSRKMLLPQKKCGKKTSEKMLNPLPLPLFSSPFPFLATEPEKIEVA